MDYKKALETDVNGKTEKKNGLTYLSWSWAWAEFIKLYPSATYEIKKNVNGLPCFGDEKLGYMVYTAVTVDAVTHEMWLPVMDFKNKSMLQPTTFDINKAVMRCLTKNLAMFGLGLYIYSGEDLPETDDIDNEDRKQSKTITKEEPKKPIQEKVSDENVKYIYTLINKVKFDYMKIYEAYKVQSMKDLTAAQATKVVEGLRKIEKEQEDKK